MGAYSAFLLKMGQSHGLHPPKQPFRLTTGNFERLFNAYLLYFQ